MLISGVGICWIGLEGVTPKQSVELAQIWVAAFDAKPNSAYGDGLSDHVSGAWCNLFTEPERFPDKARYKHRVFIAAYKTWTHGPYDPQRNTAFKVEGFPKVLGAAIKLSHAIECDPAFYIGPTSVGFLPCSEPEFKPR